MADPVSNQKIKALEQLLLEQRLMQQRVFDSREAAIYLKISRSHLYTLARFRRVPHFRAGCRIYFRRRQLDRWQAKRQRRFVRWWLPVAWGNGFLRICLRLLPDLIETLFKKYG